MLSSSFGEQGSIFSSCGSSQPQQLLPAPCLPGPAPCEASSDAEMLLEMIPIKEVRLSQFQLHGGDEKMNSVTECLQEQIYKPNHLPA